MKNKNMKMSRFVSLAGVLSLVFKIVYWVLIVALGISVIGLIAVNVLPASIIENGITSNILSFNYSIANIQFMIDQVSLDVASFKTVCNTCLMVMACLSVAFIYIVKQLRCIVEHTLSEQPFNQETIKAVRNVGIGVIVTSIVMNLGLSLINLNVFSVFNIASSLGHNISTQVNINVIDGASILIGLVIILIASVFQYGQSLQEEVDTLI